MITSLGRDRLQVARGLQRPVRVCAGARAARIVEAGGAVVREHTHDWPVLSLYVMGDAVKRQEGREVRVDRPAVILHAARSVHSSSVGSPGLEQIDIEFDPRWLGRVASLARRPVDQVWVGGDVAAAAGALRDLWLRPDAGETQLVEATGMFLERAFAATPTKRPPWLDSAVQVLASGTCPSTRILAGRLGLHPGWLAQSYKASVGEGIGDTARRLRVERAAQLLRTTQTAAAEVALAAGFCDQSHMIRSFQRVLGRSPSDVRQERTMLAP